MKQLFNTNWILIQNIFFYYRNIDKNKHFSSEIRNAIYLIPTLNMQEKVLTVLNKIQFCDELGAVGNNKQY